MPLNDHKLDTLIKEKVQSEMEQIPLPSINAEWQALKAKLDKTDRSQSKGSQQRLRLALAMGAIVLIAVLGLASPHNVQALGNRVVEIYDLVVGKTTMNKTFSSRQASPNPPGAPVVKDLGTGVEREVSLDEARKAFGDQLALPEYLPSESTLQKVTLFELGANSKRVTFLYDRQGKVFRLTEMQVLGDFSSGQLYDTDDTVTQDISVNGNPAILFVNKKGFSSLSWIQGQLHVELSGVLSGDEIQKIAASIK